MCTRRRSPCGGLPQNFWNISVYIADACSENFLVGGGEHDWAFLLTRLGWLKFDHVIARDAWFLGVLVYIVAIGPADSSRSPTDRRRRLIQADTVAA